MNEIPITIMVIIIGLIIAVIILKHPYIGVALTVASSAIIALIPPIPFFSSALTVMGMVTLVGYLIKIRGSGGKVLLRFSRIHLVSLLFIFWVFLSNPQAAWSGLDRNWVLTFIQLFVLMFMAGDILDEDHKPHVLMAIFSIIAVISAFTAISQGYIGEDIESSLRVGGFAAGSNDAARYFVIAMIFITYLRSKIKDSLIRFLLFLAILITFIGVFFTASRTGMILIFFAQLLLFFFQQEGKQRIQLIVIFGVAFLILYFSANSIIDILEGIIPAIAQGTDTVGLRYDIWRAGWLMWLDHPISGIGIGRFSLNSYLYMLQLPGVDPRTTSAHNIYIQILSETGVIGFFLFISIIVIGIKNFRKTRNLNQHDQLELRNVWLIVFLVMLLGGITKTDTVDKLLWMVLGLSVYFGNLSDESTEEKRQAGEPPQRLMKQKFIHHQ